MAKWCPICGKMVSHLGGIVSHLVSARVSIDRRRTRERVLNSGGTYPQCHRLRTANGMLRAFREDPGLPVQTRLWDTVPERISICGQHTLFKPVVVSPEAQREETEHEARLFFLFPISLGDLCAIRGPRRNGMSPPLLDCRNAEGLRIRGRHDEP